MSHWLYEIYTYKYTCWICKHIQINYRAAESLSELKQVWYSGIEDGPQSEWGCDLWQYVSLKKEVDRKVLFCLIDSKSKDVEEHLDWAQLISQTHPYI